VLASEADKDLAPAGTEDTIAILLARRANVSPLRAEGTAHTTYDTTLYVTAIPNTDRIVVGKINAQKLSPGLYMLISNSPRIGFSATSFVCFISRFEIPKMSKDDKERMERTRQGGGREHKRPGRTG
jgi:hypothetical protein